MSNDPYMIYLIGRISKVENKNEEMTEEEFRKYIETNHGFIMMYTALDLMAWRNKTVEDIREEIIKVEDWDQLKAFNYVVKNKVNVGGYSIK